MVILEEDWFASKDTVKMLRFLRDQRTHGPSVRLNRTASDRKFRLFAVGCVRKIWHLLEDPKGRRALLAAEQFADGRLSTTRLHTVWKTAFDAHEGYIAEENQVAFSALRAVIRTAWVIGPPGPFMVSQDPLANLIINAHQETEIAIRADGDQPEGFRFADLARCVFGNPFRPAPKPLPETLLKWNGGTIPKLAEAIYRDRSFEQLGVLADALEEADCGREDLIKHFRSSSPHCRGCWGLDCCLPELTFKPQVTRNPRR